MCIKYLLINKFTQRCSYGKQNYFCPTCGLIVFFLSNVIHKNSSWTDFAVQRAVCIVCSFPQLPLGSLAIYFPHSATVAAMTMPDYRTLHSQALG